MKAIEEHSRRLAALESLSEGPGREAAILAAMEDESAVIRERAIRLATRYIEPQVLGELVADEANAIRRNAAITALERQGPYAVPHLRTMLTRPEVDVVMFALQMLSRIGDPLAVHGVLPLVVHSDPNVAQAAIEALGQLRHREAVPTLLQVLKGDLWLQLAAIDALGEIGDPAAVGPLLALIPDSIVAEPAVIALQRIAAPESLEALLRKLMVVTETPLRDALLLAIGVVIDLHPDPVPVAVQCNAEIELDPARSLLGYLEEILRWEPDTIPASDTRDRPSLLRAATAVTVVAGLRSLYPPVLSRIAIDEDPAWAVGLFQRHPGALSPALRELLRHKDLRVRRGALLAGAFAPEDFTIVVEHLKDADDMVRAAACRALGQIGDPRAAPLLIKHLSGGEPSEQAAAIAALAEFPAEALQMLEGCLGPDVPEPVLVAALEVLGCRGVARFEPRIAELSRHQSPAIRRGAIKAAAQLPGAKAEVILIRGLADHHLPNQVEALDLLVQRDQGKTVPTLAALLQADDSFRCHVIRALGHMRAIEAVPNLESLYSQCSRHEQVEIVLAMTRIGGPRIPEFLRARLNEREAEIRRVAARGLARMVDSTHLALLIRLAGDADWCIRAEAARGLGRLRMAEVDDVLLTLARDVEPAVASTAREALALFRKSTGAAA
ncbi:MAG TPA: HEAT repeat domain-containing protein [Gemmatimonadales bacterium]|nr:HEAT repeat domain-containing protein [Gemmatimonadales bacterium]